MQPLGIKFYIFIGYFILCLSVASPSSSQEIQECTNRQLQSVVAQDPSLKRFEAMERLLSCLDDQSGDQTTLSAAYELAFFYGGATGVREADYDKAISWIEFVIQRVPPDQQTTLIAARTSEATIYLYQAETGGNIEALVDAANRFDRLLSDFCESTKIRAVCSNIKSLAARSHLSLFELTQDQDARRRAIELNSQLIADVDSDRQLLAEALLDRGTLTAYQPKGSLSQEEFETARQDLTTAARLHESLGNLDRVFAAELNLATMLIETGRMGREDSYTSENRLRSILDRSEGIDALTKARAELTLAGLLLRKQDGFRPGHIEEAIEVLEELLETGPLESVFRSKIVHNLALAYHYSSLQQPERNDRAVSLLDGAIDDIWRLGKETEASRMIETQVLIMINTAGEFGGSLSLEDVKARLSRAESAPNRTAYDAAQIAGLRSRFFEFQWRTDRDEDYRNGAIRELRFAVRSLSRSASPSVWASFQNNLGNLCNDRRRPDLFDCAQVAYSAALEIRTVEDLPSEYIDTTANLASLHFRHANWAIAAELYAEAAAYSEDLLFNLSANADLQAVSVAATDRWYERAAFATAKAGDLEDALLLFERGRLRLLRNQVNWRSGNFDISSVDEVRGQLEPGDLAMTFVVTEMGMAVFTLEIGQADDLDLQVHFLDHLDGKTISDSLNRWIEDYNVAFEPNPTTGDARPSAGPLWENRLETSLAWLGTEVFEPVLENLTISSENSVNRLILVPQGELALLPLHAARLRDGTYLLDFAQVVQVSSLASIGVGTKDPFETFVSVPDPTQDQSLPFAELEATVSWGGKASIVTPTNAKAFFSEVANSDALLFSGHARFDSDKVGASGLRLSRDERLTLDNIADYEGAPLPRLIVLSACESGVIETATMASEFVGLPTILMARGADHVIASLWPVGDVPTFLLMQKMTEEIADGQQPSEALRNAQLWLRDSTGQEIATVLESSDVGSERSIRQLVQVLRFRFPDDTVYRGPEAWAAFFQTSMRL